MEQSWESAGSSRTLGTMTAMRHAGIFISYRRQDSQSAAGRLADALGAMFGADKLFRDIETIAPGADFEATLDRALDSCAVLIAVIGPHWLSITDEQGRRRLDDPDDWVRREIVRALRRGIPVIPVLVDAATMPREQDVPDDLKQLHKLQALELTDKRWKTDLDLLADALVGVPGISWRFRMARHLSRGSRPAIAAVLAVGLATMGWWWASKEPQLPDYDGVVTTAVLRLSADEVNQRKDAIAELESVARASDKHGSLVLEKLAEFVRTRAPWRPDRVATRTEPDVQMALTVIGKLPKSGKLDLHNVDISGASLENASLSEVVLWGSNLRGTILARADLSKADLGGCDFTDASLEMANLQGAYLWWSDVSPPVRPAVFQGARLAGANFKDAVLYGADLTGATGLQEEQLAQAKIDSNTRLPASLHARDGRPP